jgi:hypothetical protein
MNCILSLKSSIKVYKCLAHDESSIHPKSSMKWKLNSMTCCTIAFNFLGLSSKAKLCWLTFIHDVDVLMVLNLLQRFQPWNCSFILYFLFHSLASSALVAKQLTMIEDWHNNWSCVNMLVLLDDEASEMCASHIVNKHSKNDWRFFFASNQFLFGSQILA